MKSESITVRVYPYQKKYLVARAKKESPKHKDLTLSDVVGNLIDKDIQAKSK